MEPKKPKLSRADTMKTTAEEGAEFLERQGFDWKTGGSTFITDDSDGREKEDHDNSDTDEPSAKRLKRQSTMAVTAKEGAEFLQRQGFEADSAEDAASEQTENQGAPQVKRDSTMEVTAREGAEFLARAGETREKNVMFDDQVTTTTTPSRPKLQRDSTIDVTVKEGEAFLERMGGMEDVDSATNRTEHDEEKETTTLSRPKLQRDSTIDVTVKEGEEFLRRSGGMPGNDGNETKDHSEAAANEGHETSVGDQDEEEVPSLRRDTTMKETKKIGEAFVGDEGRAETRSQTKLLRQAEQETEPSKTGRIPLKRAGTMDVTKAEGEEFLKRKKT